MERGAYQHDCKACRFLGRYEGHDLYYCKSSVGGATVIARWGDDGPEYTSGLHLAATFALKERAIDDTGGSQKHDHPSADMRALRVAFLIVRDMGLI